MSCRERILNCRRRDRREERESYVGALRRGRELAFSLEMEQKDWASAKECSQ